MDFVGGVMNLRDTGGDDMERDKVISLGLIALSLIFLAWFVGRIQGEAKEHRRNEMQGVKARLFKMEQAQHTKKEGE
ncbi:MAG: hypothetical protein C7B46_11570 [Sulfobacillus benefaciens]|uniref:Uncharacterized protein n=1 Tax=Sulfobacillus benefaciens TaxID=453960 RepID=A0A2T2XEU6_9FIRM|nr:MAG: hypothetical protein C7B46_11570 [Sulfobacillus benefaciens]